MDLTTILVILAVLYLVPEIFRRRKKKDYEYPQIPIPTQELPDNVFDATATENLPLHIGAQPSADVAVDVQGISENNKIHDTEGSATLDQNKFINGVIVAEILKPPRAKRFQKTMLWKSVDRDK